MTPERWQQVKQVLQSALERPPDQRAAFLTEACRGDPELHREVGLLLEHDTTQEIIRPAWQWKDAAAEQDGGGSGRAMPAAIGRYRILRMMGEGGMGTVYEAEQDQPRRFVP